MIWDDFDGAISKLLGAEFVNERSDKTYYFPQRENLENFDLFYKNGVFGELSKDGNNYYEHPNPWLRNMNERYFSDFVDILNGRYFLYGGSSVGDTLIRKLADPPSDTLRNTAVFLIWFPLLMCLRLWKKRRDML